MLPLFLLKGEKSMSDRNCNACARYSPEGCTAWGCEFIDRSEAIEAYKERLNGRKTCRYLVKLADNGWKDVFCSECGHKENVDIHVRLGYRFCPNCGRYIES